MGDRRAPSPPPVGRLANRPEPPPEPPPKRIRDEAIVIAALQNEVIDQRAHNLVLQQSLTMVEGDNRRLREAAQSVPHLFYDMEMKVVRMIPEYHAQHDPAMCSGRCRFAFVPKGEDE